MARIHLRDPEHEGLQFGPNAEIKFGLRGGFAPGEVWIDEDDPLLPLLMELEPHVVVVPDAGPTQVWVCPVHPDKEFKTRASLLSHFKTKGHEAIATPEPTAPAPEPAKVEA